MRNITKILLIFLIIATMASCASAKQIDIGSGYTQYPATGAGIQSAITAGNSGDIVFIHAGTYNLPTTGHINLKSGVNLQGAGYSSTILFGSASTGGVQGGSPSDGWFYGDGVSNVEISGFKFKSTATQIHDGGLGDTRNCVYVRSSTNIKLHDCYFEAFLYNDGLRAYNCDNVQVYDCISKRTGHDFVEFLSSTKNSKVSNCLIDVQINTGIRFDGVSNCLAEYCTIYADQGSGWCAIEVEDTLTNCKIDHLIIRNIHGSKYNYAVGDGGRFAGTFAVTNCVMWDCPGGYITVAATSSGNTLGTSQTSESYWVGQGYGYGAIGNSSGGGGNSSGNAYAGTPLSAITSPVSSEQVTLSSGTFVPFWSDVNSTIYNVQVSSSSDFSTIIDDQTSAGISKGLDMSAHLTGTFYVRVRAMNDVTHVYTAWSTPIQFEVIGSADRPVFTGVHGTIFYQSKLTNPVSGAVVTIGNTTWFKTYVTADDGLYGFNEIPYDSGVYDITVQATDYQTPVAAMRLNSTDIDVTQDIALVKSPSFFPPHYVTFTLSSWFKTEVYAGVTVDVYDLGIGGTNSLNDPQNGGTVAAYKHGYTSQIGQVAFEMEQDHDYILVFSDPSQGIDNFRYLVTPTDSAYNPWIYGAYKKVTAGESGAKPEPIVEENVVGYAHGFSKYNLTHDFLNISIYSKNVNPLTSYSVDVYQTYDNSTQLTGGFANQTSGSGDADLTFIVPSGMTYFIGIQAQHPDLSYSIDKTWNEAAPSNGLMPFADFTDMGWTKYSYYETIGFILLLIIAYKTGERSIKMGAFAILVVANALVFIGWFQPALGDKLIGGLLEVLLVIYIMRGD